jgi:hypothetical protein
MQRENIEMAVIEKFEILHDDDESNRWCALNWLAFSKAEVG